MTVWMLTDFCYQTGRIENVCLHPCCGSGGAVAAIWVGIGVFLTTTYRKVGEPVEVRALIMQENTEQSTLVTTLEDGSIVYMGGETSLQYPEHFSMDKREVSLQGNALFDVAGNRERPFLIETEEVRIEVLGTMFHVKSDVGSTFELSVQRGKVKVALKNKIKRCMSMQVKR